MAEPFLSFYVLRTFNFVEGFAVQVSRFTFQVSGSTFKVQNSMI